VVASSHKLWIVVDQSVMPISGVYVRIYVGYSNVHCLVVKINEFFGFLVCCLCVLFFVQPDVYIAVNNPKVLSNGERMLVVGLEFAGKFSGHFFLGRQPASVHTMP
jgi:hypothetical protein